MKRRECGLLCSADEALARRVEAVLGEAVAFHRAVMGDEAERMLAHLGPRVVLVDLRQADAVDLLARLLAGAGDTPVVAFGVPRTEPWIEAGRLDLYALEPADIAPESLRRLVARAVERQALCEKLASRRAASPPGPAAEPSARPSPPRAPSLAHALRSIERPEAVWEHALDWIASAALVSRAGIFAAAEERVYRLRAGLRCMEETRGMLFEAGDPLVRWLEANLHLVARAQLDAVRDPAARTMLARALDAMGAELLAPMHARGRLLGWVFTGNRATGIPFQPDDLEPIVTLVEQVSQVIEHALLIEEVTLQKTTAETLLETLPVGIVAVDAEGVVRRCNATAGRILGRPVEALVGRPVERAGGRLADLCRRALGGEEADGIDGADVIASDRVLLVSARRLAHGAACLGAVVLIEDVTAEAELRVREERLERARFWTDLAAGMAHEIRNPLVAIKTFAQLLPERYGDPEFRAECSQLVAAEADRLNAIVEQIHGFAYPRPLEAAPVDMEAIVRRALHLAGDVPDVPPLPCHVRIDLPLPVVQGDAEALAEAVAHLVRNAGEALAGRSGGRIDLHVRPHTAGRETFVEITVRDNGPGFTEAMRERAFSPFGTTKARGLGLGLPIAQRTLLDHGGGVDIEAGDRGAAVTLRLPATPRPGAIAGRDWPVGQPS